MLGQTQNDELVIGLLDLTLNLAPDQREAYLRSACGADTELFSKVWKYVQGDERMKGFLLEPFNVPALRERPFQPGELLADRFRIVREVAQGGMGVVYEAIDEKLERRIALKTAKMGFRKRLSPEAIQSLSVTHANVCRVFEIHTVPTDTGDVDFLTMEFLEGETLADRLPRAPANWLRTAEGLEIARQICTGLKAVHGAGIIHRDLKPGNVMLSTGAASRLRVVIMDFGLAQGGDIFSSQVRGTPAYLAPELWKAQPATVQSDLYALGVLLYEMASGRQPFPEGTEWDDRLRGLPPAPDVREPFRSAVLRCLDPDQTRRFQNVEELEQALWGGRSRRWLLRAAVVLPVSGLTGAYLNQHFWPSSALHLAMLPPSISEGVTDALPLINGFLHDLSYHLKTLRSVRRPLGILSLAQTEPEGVKTAAAAQALFGATHAISSSFQKDTSGWLISVELVETASGRSLRRWDRLATSSDLAGQLFLLQSIVVQDTLQQLRLGVEPKRQTLTRESYADYLQGLYYTRGEYEDAPKAIPYFERVVSAAPSSALAYAGLAEAFLGARYALSDKSLEGKAITALAKAEQLDPESSHVRLMSGRLNNSAGWYERALADLHRASELAPNDAEPFIEMAYSLYLLNRLEEAEAALRAGIAVEPGNFRPYLDLGQFFYERRNFAQAERYWLEAVRLGPGQTQARLNLADIYIATGRTADAETQTLESLKIRRTQGALKTLGALQEQAGRYTDAIASYEEAIRIGPRTYMIWAGLGVACRRAAREPEAVRAFRSGLENTEEGIRAYPREAERVAWSAYYHASLGEVEQARSRATQAVGMASPPLVSVRKLLVLSYDLIHDKESALRLLDGAPPDLLKELARSADISDALRRDPNFERLTH